jgi:hypothetical protein
MPLCNIGKSTKRSGARDDKYEITTARKPNYCIEESNKLNYITTYNATNDKSSSTTTHPLTASGSTSSLGCS